MLTEIKPRKSQARYPELVLVGKGSGLIVKTREEGKVAGL
jgi:hypothetical protein